MHRVLTSLLLAIGSSASLAAEPLEFPSIRVQETKTLTYRCGDGATFPVTYFNTEDRQGFAVLSLNGRQRVFVAVLSGSGAKYASGIYVWWTKGTSGNLWNETAPEQPVHGNCMAQDERSR